MDEQQMKSSSACTDIIRDFGTFYSKATKIGDSYVIAYDHWGPDVKPGMAVTKDSIQTEIWLRDDVAKSEKIVNDNIYKFAYIGGLKQYQFDALVSFSHKYGQEGLANIAENIDENTTEVDIARRIKNYSDNEVVKERLLEEANLFSRQFYRAVDVLHGKYGNGQERITRLGKYYHTTQTRINEWYDMANAALANQYGNRDLKKELKENYAPVMYIISEKIRVNPDVHRPANVHIRLSSTELAQDIVQENNNMEERIEALDVYGEGMPARVRERIRNHINAPVANNPNQPLNKEHGK